MKHAPPPPRNGPPRPWVHDGEVRVHRLMTRERFPWLHDLLASTSMDGEDTIFAELDNRMSLFQGQGWREDRAMLAALAAEARRFNRRHPPGAPDRRAAWWALGGVAAAEPVMERLLDELAALDGGEA